MAAAVIVDVGPAALPTWMYRAPTFAWFIAWGGPAPQEVNDHVVAAGRRGGQPGVDGLVIGEVDDRVGPAVSGEGSTATGGADDPAGAQDPGRLHRELARRAAGPEDQ